MTTLWLGMTALLALAWLMLVPALRVPPHVHDALYRANAQVLALQLESLDRDLLNGVIDAEQHRLACIEVQRRAVGESQAQAPVQARSVSRRTALVVALMIGAAAVALYARLGSPGAIDSLQGAQATTATDAEVSRESVEAMIAKLDQRLQAAPTNELSNLEGWKMVARSYATLQRFADADRAYARALALSPNDAQLLADRADILAMLQGQRATGEPERLIGKALQIDPNNLKALAMSGSAAFQRKDFSSAKAQWLRARELAPPGSDFAAGLDRSLDEVRSAEADADSKPLSRPAIDAAKVVGRVSLSPDLAARASPTDTVFVLARAARGPRMPLAIIRRTVAELPFDFALDDSMAMSPQAKLSSFARVVVSARISRSSDATPQPGDLYGDAQVDTRETSVQLLIDSVQH